MSLSFLTSLLSRHELGITALSYQWAQRYSSYNDCITCHAVSSNQLIHSLAFLNLYNELSTFLAAAKSQTAPPKWLHFLLFIMVFRAPDSLHAIRRWLICWIYSPFDGHVLGGLLVTRSASSLPLSHSAAIYHIRVFRWHCAFLGSSLPCILNARAHAFILLRLGAWTFTHKELNHSIYYPAEYHTPWI